jgi:hypothetical protein
MMMTVPPPSRILPPPAPAAIARPEPAMPAWAAYGMTALAWVLAAGSPLVASAARQDPFAAALAGPVLALFVIGGVSAAQGHHPRDFLGVLPVWPLTCAGAGLRWRQWWATLLWALPVVAAAPAAYTLTSAASPAWGLPSVADFAVYAPWTVPVLVGVTGALLTAARRPTAEVYAVGVLAALASGVVGFGWGAPAVVPTALGLMWLYLRTRRLGPLLTAAALPALAAVLLVLAGVL